MGDKNDPKEPAPASRQKEGCGENVIDLLSFRKQIPAAVPIKSTVQENTVFYISDSGCWLDMLRSFKSLEVEDIRSVETLKTKLYGKTPDLIFLESSFDWACPFETIDRLDYLLEVPIVLICDSSDQAHTDLVKKAFSAGVHDTLYAPLNRDELSEILDVLLKFQNRSLHQ